MSLPWKKEYELGIEIIDTQHKEFVQALNDLYLAIGEGNVKEKIYRILSEIQQYVDLHFQTEENYFDEFEYEGAAEHKIKHQEFRDKFAEIKDKYKNDELGMTFELTDFMEDWLLDHLVAMDKKYVTCFKEHGLK